MANGKGLLDSRALGLMLLYLLPKAQCCFVAKGIA
jgi:hypothetical protein